MSADDDSANFTNRPRFPTLLRNCYLCIDPESFTCEFIFAEHSLDAVRTAQSQFGFTSVLCDRYDSELHKLRHAELIELRAILAANPNAQVPF